MPLQAARSLNQIIEFLYQNISLLREKQILAGFDGFIDTIVKPVRGTDLNGDYEYFDTIAEFGAFISGHAHKSTSIQYKVVQRRPGGNMPNFVRALDALSLSPIAIGMLSAESGGVDPLFSNLGGKRYSYLAAGPAMPLEFNDGKIFLSPVNIPGISPDEKVFARIESAFPEFRSAAAEADLIAFLNWSELPFAQDLWEDIYLHALSGATIDKNRVAFFDLCETAAKSQLEVETLISLIGKISERRRTIISLNKNEALDIAAKSIGKSPAGGDFIQSYEPSDTKKLAELLFKRLPVDELVIHHHKESLAVSAEEDLAAQACVFNENPKISTGSGDHFNAAYCLASLAGLSIKEKLEFANAYSGSYISRGLSPGLQDLEKV